MTTYITNLRCREALDSIVDDIETGGTGTIVIYSGSIPADADASAGTEVATLTFSATAFGNAADSGPGATATANAITNDTSATGGTATHFRFLNGAGTAVLQGAVGTGSEEMVLNTDIINAGAIVSITAATVFLPEND